jgi:HlyD family secretion protein
LLKDEAATQKQLDDINSQIDVFDKQIKSIEVQNSTVFNELKAMEKQIEQIDDQINRSVLKSPVTGTVLEKYAEQYELAIMGKPIYKIANLSKLELRVYISGSQLNKIKLRQKVNVLIDENAEENKKLKGEITWISEQSEFTPKIIQTKEERVNLVYAVKISVKNDGSLKIGMPGEVLFNAEK